MTIGAAHPACRPRPKRTAAIAGVDGHRRATEWLNSPRLTPASLAGKVVLVDFWTYTCINWLRTLPYVRAWAQKYREASSSSACTPPSSHSNRTSTTSVGRCGR